MKNHVNRSSVLGATLFFITISGFANEIKSDQLSLWINLQSLVSASVNFVELNKLTSSGDPIKEIESAKNVLMSNLSTQYKCKFPARFLFLKNNFSTIKGDLTSCAKFQSFRRRINSDYVSILFASEYLNAPSSAFGHTMLLFHKNEKISPFDDVIHFSASPVKNDFFLKYIYKGLTGGYSSGFYIDSSFRKIHEYLVNEQRRIYQYELHLNNDQRQFLEARLYELFQFKYKYYFFTKNCSYYIEEVLKSLFINESKAQITPYRLPIMAIKSAKVILQKEPTVHLPYFEIAKVSKSRLSPSDNNLFRKIVAGKASLSLKDSAELKDAVFYLYKYNFRKNRMALPNYKLNLRNSTKVSPSNLNFGNIDNPLYRTNPTTIELSYLKGLSGTGDSIRLMSRPVNQDIFTNQFGRLHESTLSLGEVVLLKERSAPVKIDSISLARVFLHRNILDFNSPISWFGNFKFSRENKFKSLSPNLNLGAGVGFGRAIKLSFLPGLSLAYYKNFSLAPIFKFTGITYLTSKIKFASTIDVVLRDKNLHYVTDARVSYKFNSWIDYLIGFRQDTLFDDISATSSLRVNF